MLNYLGPSGPQGPVTASLPPAVPGTMPDAVPGIPSTQALPPPVDIHKAPLPPSATPHIHALAKIMRANLPAGNAKGIPAPPKDQYSAVTQEDGSVVLHLKNANGTLGPAVKIIPPIKAAKV